MKLYDYLACEKPILAFLPEGEAATIVRKTESGFVITGEDIKTSVQVLRHLYDLKFGDGEGGGKISSPAETKMIYDARFLTGKLSEVLAMVAR